MTGRRQGNKEHIADYFYDKLRLCQDLNLSFHEIRDHIVLGIHSQELAVYAMSRYHTTTATLLADLQEGGRMFELCRAQDALVKPSEDKGWRSFPKTQPKPAASAPTAVVHRSNVATIKSMSIGESTTVRCYNCNTNGHIARDCPKPRKPCSGCQSTAHTRSRCPEKLAQAMLVGPLLTVSQNSFIKDLMFNDVRATCLIDTGSSHVLVRTSLVHRSAVTVHWTPRPLFTVGDTHHPCAVTQGEATADITVDGALGADHPVLVVSDHSIPVDVIVGRSWLNLPHIVFYKTNNQFIIETVNSISPSATAETTATEPSEIRTALVSADQPPVLPILLSDVNVDAQASETERSELLLLINNYRDVFAKILTELGCTPLAEMDIVEVDGSVPVRQTP